MKLAILLHTSILLCAFTAPTLAADATGFYAGASIGYGAGQARASEVNGSRNYFADTRGGLIDSRIGLQQEIKRWVVGGELTVGYLNLDSDTARQDAGGLVYTQSSLHSYGTVAARAGYHITNSWIVFGKIGIAAAQLDSSTNQSCPTGACGLVISNADTDNITFGLAAGAGLSYKISDRVSIRTEYEHLHFREELALPASTGPAWNHGINAHNIKLGLDYNF